MFTHIVGVKKCFGSGNSNVNGAAASPVGARSISGGSTAARSYARAYRFAEIKRRTFVSRSSADGNEITPKQSTATTSGLSCAVPLSGLTSSIPGGQILGGQIPGGQIPGSLGPLQSLI